MQLEIKELNDLKKLESWTIDKVSLNIEAKPTITLQLHHLLAEKPVKLRITGDVTYNVIGSLTQIIPGLNFKVEDVG